jgi:hypothetical protein
MEGGVPWIGNRPNANTYEDLMHTYPDDASLGAYIRSGMGGRTPRPELTGNDLRDFIYFIRRGTYQGSLGPTPVQPGPNDPDITPPNILTASAVRESATQITVSWTTNEPTIGVAAAASATQYNTFGHYPMYSEIEGGYATSHSMPITVISGLTPIHYTVVVKDQAGNFSHAIDQTVA